MNCVYMGGEQAGKRRDVSVLSVHLASGGAVKLEVADSSGGKTKTYLLDKIREVRMVPLDADNFTPEDRTPAIRLQNGTRWPMESTVLLRQV